MTYNYRNYKKFTLLLLFSYAIVFAFQHYYKVVINNYTPSKVSCEGIILNKNINYHITSKETIDRLKAIRPNLIINPKDILLHYNTYDVEKTTPSYWGSLIYSRKLKSWCFLVDKSVSNDVYNANNAMLPFIKGISKYRTKYYKPKDTISQAVLMNDILYVNSLSGNRNTRYYIALKKNADRCVLSFYDDGLKRSYSIRDKDTIAINFNTQVNSKQQALFEYSFNNTSNGKGQYLLINKGGNFVVKNTENQLERDVNNTFFTIEDIAFRITPKFSFFKKLLLALYLLIIGFSFIYFWSSEFKQQHKNLVVSYKNLLILSLFIFQLLGFSILVQTFELIKLKNYKYVVLSVVVPLIPLVSHLLQQHKDLIIRLILKMFPWFDNSSFNLKTEKIKQWYYIVFFIIIYTVGVLFFNKNERIYGIPVLHFFKLLIWVLIWFIYNPNFNVPSFIKKSSYASFLKSIIIFFVASINSFLTNDYGSLAFVFFACVILEYSVGNFPLTLSSKRYAMEIKITPKKIILSYCIFAFSLFLVGAFFNMGDQFYRITFAFWNPSSFLYDYNSIADRETISLLYQNLKLIFSKYPYGIHDVQIPSYARSVSHTDYALHWCLIRYGVLFFIPLLLNTFLFIRAIAKLIYVLRGADDEYQCYTNKTRNYQMFVVFVLIYTLLQVIMPVLSNFLLPCSFLTGIPFPGVGISTGDALFLFVLLTFLGIFQVNPNFNYDTTALKEEANSFSLQFSINVFKIIGVLFLLKMILLFYQSEESAFSYPQKGEIKSPTSHTNDDWVKYTASVFKGKDITNLSTRDRRILNQIKCSYYGGVNNKLRHNKKYFYLNTTLLEKKICPTFKFLRTKKRISSTRWNQQYDTVYQYHKFVNGKKEYFTTSPYFDAIDLNKKSLNRDQTALVNREIESFVGKHKKLEIKVLVSENNTNELIIDANYPLNNTFKNPSFYPASPKKIILAYHYANQSEPVTLYSNNHIISPEKWIATSSNEASVYYFLTLKDLEGFKKFLLEHFDLTYTSNSYQNGYNTNNSKAAEVVIIGGKIKYTSYQINKWIRACANNVFIDNNTKLKRMLNAPLLSKHGIGTAIQTAKVLRQAGFNPNNFICKTGTLESTSGAFNLGTSFVIANKNYSFTVLINGYASGKHAKDLFNQLVPLLKPYLI